ncbi:MAG: acyl carrier protein phosphodiesterase [Candidatus Sumerlaeota bacterium]|nr:acyl carrier protein phosphodiesterase [Candidatus Sumerlaeota bacterium]
MNFLAHLTFADPTPESMAGNLMADFLRGALDPGLPEEVRVGIMLHRRVDAFTDAHPLFHRSRNRIRPRWGRYSPILVDIFYDHVLAREWDEFACIGLGDFVREAHAFLAEAEPLMPEVMQRVMARMRAEDWLLSYAENAGIAATLARLERRFKRPPPEALALAADDLAAHYEGLAEDFREFFPELRAHVEEATGHPSIYLR